MVKLICLVAVVSLMSFAVGCGPKEDDFGEKASTGTQITETVQTTDGAATTEDSATTTEETTAVTTDDGTSDDNNNWTGIY